ncbi:MAG: hypothetical protein ABI683_17075 [Ginsengibacter sp.]
MRIASAMCFIGHGVFGIITKPIWVNYFGVFGIHSDTAWQLMPLVGVIDLLLGLAILFYPVRAVFAWLVIWGTVTALLRPLSGEPFAEFIERAGNFGAPLAFLVFAGLKIPSVKSLFIPVRDNIQTDTRTMERLVLCLRVITFLLIAGHGWLNLIEKKTFLDIYRSLGFANPGTTAQAIGLFEIVAAFAIVIRPVRSIVLMIFCWKVLSEIFYPHYGLFEWIERGGSYGTLLALWFALNIAPHTAGIRFSSWTNLFFERHNRPALRETISNLNQSGR